MDFALSKEQDLFRSTIRKYLHSMENTKAVCAYMEGDTKPFSEIWRGLSELGSMGITISEEYGGSGFGQIDLIPALEEIGRVLLPGIYLETAGFAVPMLECFGTEEQKQTYLPEIATGAKRISLAWLEPNSVGYRQQDIQMTSRENGEMLSLNGQKTLVPDGDAADTLIVPVRMGEKGISLVLLDRDTSIWESRPLESIDETRRLVEITFSNIQVPKQQILGTINEGWEVLQAGLLHLNAALAATMVGGMDQVVEMAVDYANSRHQFGNPIGRYQAIKHRIVEMKVDLETARSLTYYANWAIDTNAEDKLAAVASARVFTTEAYIRAAGHNIQIHGGIGYTAEVDCHLYLKRARSLESYLGYLDDYYELIAKGMG